LRCIGSKSTRRGAFKEKAITCLPRELRDDLVSFAVMVFPPRGGQLLMRKIYEKGTLGVQINQGRKKEKTTLWGRWLSER